MNVQRPDLTTKQCPTGTVPCSSVTSLENTICYPEEKRDSNCPITEIRFVTSQTLAAYTSNPDYVVQQFSSVSLVYTKFAKDSLPVTKTFLETKPCMIAKEGFSSALDEQFYPLMVQQFTQCSVDKATSLKFDPDFKDAGLSIDKSTLE